MVWIGGNASIIAADWALAGYEGHPTEQVRRLRSSSFGSGPVWGNDSYRGTPSRRAATGRNAYPL